MAIPEFNLRQLLESGAHFGHRTQRWNPKMAVYIFGVRNDIHIMDLTQTVPLFHQALLAMRDIVAAGGRVSSAPSGRLRNPLLRQPSDARSTI